MKREIQFVVNGEERRLLVREDATLLDVLRNDLRLTGAKKGCGKGECGACTVIMNGLAVASCIVPIGKAENAVIETVENLAHDGVLSLLQQQFLEQGAVQCGFCTPGMLMSAKALLDHDHAPSREAIREAIGGNICRCTGYVKIEKAIAETAKRMREGCV